MNDIIGTLRTAGKFNTLLSLLELSGLQETLAESGPFTLFAPSDDAFEKVVLEELTAEKDKLVSILSYHFAYGDCHADDIAKEDKVYTANGKALTVRFNHGEQVIDNAHITNVDIVCSNGTVHAIDNVFLPQFSGWYCGGCC